MQQHPPRQRLRSNALALSDGVQRSLKDIWPFNQKTDARHYSCDGGAWLKVLSLVE
jgi:hypothetical protein